MKQKAYIIYQIKKTTADIKQAMYVRTYVPYGPLFDQQILFEWIAIATSYFKPAPLNLGDTHFLFHGHGSSIIQSVQSIVNLGVSINPPFVVAAHS